MELKNFKWDQDADGIVTIFWDVPNRTMNVLTGSAIGDLLAVADKVSTDASIKGLIITSGKKTGFTPHSSCQIAGVPMFMGYGGGNPIIFLQTPKEVWLFFSGDMQVRRVYMNVPRSPKPQPSWYGESVGHYEGETLLIDTIGLNDKTTADIYRTPHTENMHVVERWRMVDGGDGMEVVFTVEDPEAFYQPWTAMRH